MKFAVTIICALLSGAAFAQQREQGSKTWAVVIGISKYQKLPGGQQLQFADRDATLFAETVEKKGVSPQNVRLLTSAEATTAAVKSAIGNWLARSASESDTVLIFFSGHGMVEREFGEAYLLGYDSDPKDPYATALSVTEITAALTQRIRSGRVVVIMDATRRDFFDPDSDPDSAKSFARAFEGLAASRPGVLAIVASGPGEFSREGQRWGGHGAFAKHLADVLIDGAQRNGDLALSADELFDLLKARVADDTSNKQHPWRSPATLARVTQPKSVEIARQPQRQVAEATVPQRSQSGDKPEITTRTPAPAVPREEKKSESTPVVASVSGTQPGSTTSKLTTETPVRAAVTPKPTPASAPEPARPPVSRAPTPPSVEAVKTGQPATSPSRAPASSEVARVDISTPPNPAPRRTPTPPGVEAVNAGQLAASSPRGLAPSVVATAEIPAPPKPKVYIPNAAVVSDRETVQPEKTLAVSVPTSSPEVAPTPLVLQISAAIASKNLIEPKNNSAWDLYMRLASEPSASADAARVKPVLAAALIVEGRALVGGDVRSDNIADKVDDFKRAGQMLARARSLTPDSAEAVALEKLSAVEALISLQFFDEAERALSQLQAAKLAVVDNALGLVYQGKLDGWRAERAFKRAIELDSKWAAPHYNLALLYRSQQNQASLAEFEAAAALDPTNVNLVAASGDEYFARQQFKQAADSFRKAVALRPSDDGLHTKLGHALYSQGLQDEANREYQRARELRGKQP
ncbi:MAG TPA: caspase family protein [Blastocatellia bacterium]